MFKLHSKENKKSYIKIKKLIIYIIISVLIELVLSNITYLNLLACDEKNYVAEVSSNYTEDGNYSLEINTNEIQVQNIKIYYKSGATKSGIINYTPKIVIYGIQNEERTLSTKYCIGDTNTKININAENKCLELSIEINGLVNNNDIDKVVINDTNIEFSAIRFLVILIILLFVNFIKRVNKNVEYDEKNKKQLCVFYSIILVILIGIFIEIRANETDLTICTENTFYARDFINAQIESILNNKTEILLEPTEQLLNLENPYDNSLRKDEALTQHVDYSLYNGKFYSYFGITPLIILMLPFKLITGFYLNNIIANFIFFTIMVFTLAKLYRMLIKRYIKHVKYFNFILGFLTIFFSSIAMYLARGMVYDIEINCAILFTMLSYILILSIYNNPKEKVYRKIILCSISMGLMVLSKPSFIIYYILLFYLLVNLRKVLDKKEFINCIKIGAIPIIILAIIQMCWNKMRFGSIFSFGAQYQLTAFDMNNLTYFSPLKILKGIYQYLFTLPVFDIAKFPFIFIKDYGWINIDLNVILYDTSILGIFVVPISWIYFLYNSIRKNLKITGELNKTILILVLSSILLLIINIRNGVEENYATDIRIFLYMFAVILYFKIFENIKNPIIKKVFLLVCIASILLTLPINITINKDYFNIIDKNFEVYIKNIFEFWI